MIFSLATLIFMNPLLSVGLDEAGRGPVIGPMVLAIVSATKEDLLWMRELRVRDSKTIRAKERDMLSAIIRERCWYEIVVIHPAEIDQALASEHMSLNTLERDAMIALIRAFQEKHPKIPAEIIADAIGRYADKYAETLIKGAKSIPHHSIRAECRADTNHLIVGAASIVAKTERERHIALLREKIGIDFGSGYCSDPKTKLFLTTCDLQEPCIRRSWSTAKNVRRP